MAFITAHAPHLPTIPASIRRLLDGLGHALVAYTERHSRVDEIERLNAMSDAELEALGIRRDRIVYQVFSDRFWY